MIPATEIAPTGATHRAQLDAENPWPGLDAYGEASSAFFKGREEEAIELMRLIRLSALTVVYGKSGLGKTSLLEAGLFPLLRAEHYLPVYLRLDFSRTSKEQPLRQALQNLKDAVARANAESPAPEPTESLWEYLHHKNPEIWSSDNYPLIPVLVFDQFEELFSRTAGNTDLIRQVFDDLADLIENRIPGELASDEAGGRRSRLDLFAQNYRIVLSFREDFLPQVRTWEKQVPSLLRSSLRLEPMSAARAIKAVEEAGKDVLDAGVAVQIVDFVGRPDHPATAALETPEMAIEPVLLSLCCTQLNRRRTPGGKIDRTLLEGAGEDILENFYRGALDDQDVKGPPDVAQFIEDKLIQGGFRGDYPKQEALDKSKLTEKQLTALTGRLRLLRLVPHADTVRIELIHDRLVPVIAKARDERAIRERQFEQERKAVEAEAERDKERARSSELSRSLKAANRNRNIALAAALLSGILLAWGWFQQQSKERAKQSAAVAVNTARLAEGRLALGPGREPLEQTMYRGLAAYRLTNQGMSQAKSASLTALHWVLENSLHLRKAVTIDSLVPTPALTYSPVGSIIAVGGEDGRIRLIDAETYRVKQLLDCHAPPNESVWALSFNSDGNRLAAGYSRNDPPEGSGLVCVFDVAQHSILKRWSGSELWGKTTNVYSIAYGGSPGSEFVVSGGSDKILRWLDVQTGAAHASLPQAEPISALAVSAGGRLVASGSDPGAAPSVVRIWNTADLRGSNAKPIHELRGHYSAIEQVEFSPDDPSKLLSAGDDGRIMVWDVQRVCKVQQSEPQPAKIIGIAIQPKDSLVAAAVADGNVRLFRFSNQALPCMADDNSNAKPKTAGQREFGVVQDGVLSGHGGFVMSVAWNAAGTRLASTGQDGSIRIWGPANSSFSQSELRLGASDKPPPLFTSVTKLVISPDGQTVAAGDTQGLVHVWNQSAPIAEPVVTYASASWKAHDAAVRVLAYVRVEDRQLLVSGSDDGVLKRWDPSAEAKFLSPEMAAGAPPIVAMAVSPDGKTVAAGSQDGSIRLWDAATGKLKQTLPRSPDAQQNYTSFALGFSSDGKHLAAGDSTTLLSVRDLEKPASTRTLKGHALEIVDVSSGGDKWLLSAGSDGSVLEWEEAALARPQKEGLKKQDEFKYRMGFRNLRPLTSMAMSANGEWIVTGGKDGRIQLWDGKEHVLIGTHILPGDATVQAVAIAPDGSFYATATGSSVLVWPGPDRWADMICSKLVSNMSSTQWREWISPEIPYKDQCPGLQRAPD